MKGRVIIKIGIFLIMIGLILTSYDTVYGSVSEYLNDVNLSKEISAFINVKYDVFNDDVDRYKTSLEELYDSYDIYLDEFNTSNIDIVNNIATINVNLVEMLNTAEKLKTYCNYDIGGSIKKEKCDIFIKNYKGSVDSYHKAIDEYNRIINLYNRRGLNNKKKIDNYVSPIDKELNNLYEEL